MVKPSNPHPMQSKIVLIALLQMGNNGPNAIKIDAVTEIAKKNFVRSAKLIKARALVEYKSSQQSIFSFLMEIVFGVSIILLQ